MTLLLRNTRNLNPLEILVENLEMYLHAHIFFQQCIVTITQQKKGTKYNLILTNDEINPLRRHIFIADQVVN